MAGALEQKLRPKETFRGLKWQKYGLVKPYFCYYVVTMIKKRIRCAYCASFFTKKDGVQDGVQRYECNECGRKFRSKRRTQTNEVRSLWHDYSHGKQTLAELGKKHRRSHVWIRTRLDEHHVELPHGITPQPTIIMPDTTFWGRHYGVCVFRSWDLKKNIWWNEVESEKVAHYYYGRRILEEKGWVLLAAVVDGRRGLARVFEDIPVQICHFHQLQTMTRYLTRRPKTEAGKELRVITLTLTTTTERELGNKLALWEKTWGSFIAEKTRVAGTRHWYYTHKNVRSAFLSLKRNLPHLFTYQRYPHLNIPNTTNTIDGYFASVKKKVAAHHGLRRDRRYKMISELLRGDEDR